MNESVNTMERPLTLSRVAVIGNILATFLQYSQTQCYKDFTTSEIITPYCACVTVSANALRNDAKEE